MPRFLVAIHHPKGFDAAASVDSAVMADIDRLNDEMVEAGVRLFVGGLQPPASAWSLVAQPDGSVRQDEGLYLQTSEYVGGFWVLDVGGVEEALAWGRKAVAACRAPVEVRPFH